VLTASCLGVALSSASLAQTSAVPDSSTESVTLEVITVTAQKRQETAQEVPIAIDVITGDAFIREGIRDVKDIQKMSTELEINSNFGQATNIGVRGMQQNGAAQTTDPLTAVHIDGGYLPSFYALNGLMFDLERVEVLAGPQGTLYGRNSAAGAVNLITRKPGDKFEANGMVEYGSESTVRVGGGVSVPFSDTFRVRLAAQKYTRDALFSDGAFEQDNWSARLSAIWDITESDELLFTTDYSDFGGTTADATTLYAVNHDARLPNGQIPASVTNYANSPTLRDPYNTLPYITQRGQVFFGNNEQNSFGAMAQYTHDFGGFSAVLQYSRREIFDAVARAHTRTITQPVGTMVPVEQQSNSAELRFLSDSGGQFEWVGGLFYFDSTSRGWNATPAQLNAPDPVTGNNIPWCPCSALYYPNYGDAWSYAVFGQTTWTPPSNEALHITAGLRYSKDWKDAHLGYWAAGVPVFAFGINETDPEVQAIFAPSLNSGVITDQANGDNEREWDNVQWKVGVDYDVTDSSMVYASVSTGYKSGALTFGPTPELKPEEILAYEIGTKNRFFDDTLQVNASAWFYDYENVEASLYPRALITPFLLPTGAFQNAIFSTANVKKANLAGMSSDIDWLATDADQFGLSFTYVWSEIKDGNESLSTCAPVLTCSLLAPGQENLVFNEGERLGDAPKWVVLGRYSHTFNFANGSRVNPALKYQWQSEKWDQSAIQDTRFYPNGRLNRFTAIPSRGILDVSLKFTSPSETWDVTGYVNNATDELNIKSLAYDPNPASAIYGLTTATVGEPRTYGVVFTARFE
jgi:iron complex outermembrane receptor protein